MSDRASSGVRNLRAMFENQNAASSPEPRGRSPAGNGANDGASRPTSKVRASFVSVEPSGHIVKDLGASKGTSVNCPAAHRRESFSISDDLGEAVPTELKRVVSEEKEQREKSSSVAETIPEQAVETRESSRAPPPIREAAGEMPNLGSIMKGSDFPEPVGREAEQSKAQETATQAVVKSPTPEKAEQKSTHAGPVAAPAQNPDKIVTGVQEEASLKPADLKDEAAVSGGQALPPPTEVLQPSNATGPAPETPKAKESKPKANGKPATHGQAAAKKPSAISTAKASAAKASSAKSPLPKSPSVARVPKTPTTPRPITTPSAAKSPAPTKAPSKTTAPKESAKGPAPKTSRASLRPSTATTGTTTIAAAKTKAAVTESKKPAAPKPTTSAPAPKDSTTTSPGGFKKPRPKSPTRPVRLPSHLTAPTASSAAKHGEDATAPKLARKPSTVSRPAPKVAPTAHKQPSRASLAPSTMTSKRPESRASTKGASDEGFLARMMRPTAASASKTHEKPTSPPRRGPSVRAPAKPKEHDNIVAKGKKKVEEVVSKAKGAVTNGHSEEQAVHAEQARETSVNMERTAAESATNGAVEKEPARAATPVERAESSTVELQTPSFGGQAIR